MLPMRMLIHHGSNDDRWYLCRGDWPTDVFVFHDPNGPSGGMASRIELASFLGSENGSPEHQALLVMIGTLVGAEHESGAPTVPEPGAAGAEPTPGEVVSFT